MVEVEGNDTNDNLAYDDNAHKAVFCTNSLILCAWLLFGTLHGFTKVKENNFNDTLACNDDAHKAVLCNHTHFFSLIITNFIIKIFFACFITW